MKLLRRLKAKLLNTFLADCPKCHKHFYGHEEYAEQIKIGHKTYRILCPTCHTSLNASKAPKNP